MLRRPRKANMELFEVAHLTEIGADDERHQPTRVIQCGLHETGSSYNSICVVGLYKTKIQKLR